MRAPIESDSLKIPDPLEETVATLTTPVTLTAGDTVWIVIKHGSYGADFYRWSYYSDNQPAWGLIRRGAAAGTWAALASGSLGFKLYGSFPSSTTGYSRRFKKTSDINRYQRH